MKSQRNPTGIEEASTVYTIPATDRRDALPPEVLYQLCQDLRLVGVAGDEADKVGEERVVGERRARRRVPDLRYLELPQHVLRVNRRTGGGGADHGVDPTRCRTPVGGAALLHVLRERERALHGRGVVALAVEEGELEAGVGEEVVVDAVRLVVHLFEMRGSEWG